MATSVTLIPVEEYLRTVYRPDCDYVDGEVLDRNMGEKPHARLQTFFGRFFGRYEDDWNIEVLAEQRLQINPRRYRIPDIMVLALPNLDERIVRTPPLLCIEILSSEDRLRKVQERLQDYADLGVRAMWVIDPWRRVVYNRGPEGTLEPVDERTGRLEVPGTSIGIEVSAVWSELERLEARAQGRKS
jgi:Uma2 family endonuclease